MPGAAVQGVALWPKKKNPKYVQMAACTKQSIQGLSRYGLSPYLSKALITILQGNTFTIQTTHGHICQHGMAWVHD